MTAKADRPTAAPMTDEERKRRLGAVYALLLDLAARQRAQAADQTTQQTEIETTNARQKLPVA